MRGEHDWIVIGSGFGGSVSALRLAEKTQEDASHPNPQFIGVNPSLTITAMAEHAMSHIPPRAQGPAPADSDMDVAHR